MSLQNIQCARRTDKVVKAHKAVTQYCWVSGTYTVPDNSSEGTKNCPFSGFPTFTDSEPKCRDVHNYYQWVPYVLVLMGLMFLLPNQLWKYLEEEKIDSIVKGIKDQKKYKLKIHLQFY